MADDFLHYPEPFLGLPQSCDHMTHGENINDWLVRFARALAQLFVRPQKGETLHRPAVKACDCTQPTMFQALRTVADGFG